MPALRMTMTTIKSRIDRPPASRPCIIRYVIVSNLGGHSDQISQPQKCRGTAAKPGGRSGDPACRSRALYRARGCGGEHREDRKTGRRWENQHLPTLVNA